MKPEARVALSTATVSPYPGPEMLGLVEERFDRTRRSFFDREFNEIACAAALERKILAGFDNIVGAATTFRVGGGPFREDLVSDASGSIARHRSIVCALSTVVFGSPERPLPDVVEQLLERNWRVYLAERNTPLFRYLHEHLSEELFTFSEYLGEDRRSGEIVDGVRHEDLQTTSFPDRSFDLIITSEVMEHVPDAPRAERELERILRPNGAYCFTAPLDPLADSDTILAERLDDGTLLFHGEPVYHGDPYRSEGILAYRIFSVADLERRFASAGCDLVTYRYWCKSLGILGADSWVHVVRKPSG